MECNTNSDCMVAEWQQTGFIFELGSLYSYLLRLSDKRKRRGLRYRLVTVLVVMILAKLCGQDKPYGMADWAKNRQGMLVEMLKLSYPKLPHHSTYRRIMETVLGIDELERLMSEYLQSLPETGQSVVIAIDGKTLRGTLTPENPFGLHLLAAYLPGEGIVLMQMEVEKDKENEIVVAPKLLKSLDLRGKVVMGDAMHTQREVSIQIVEAGGEYVWIVKANQPKTREAIEKLFEPQKPLPGLGVVATDFQTTHTVDKKHGRLEERTLTASSLLNDYLDWPYLGQVFKLERKFTNLQSGKVTHETVYGITSMTRDEAGAERLLELSRQYWGIENGLHYRRDVTFQEDSTRLTRGNAGHVMAMLNNLVLGLFAKTGARNMAQARRRYDACPDVAFSLVSARL